MPKVSLEEGLWQDPRVMALCAKLGCETAQAVGALAQLWHRTRAAGFEAGPAQTLFPMLPTDDPAQRNRFMRALVDSGFIQKQQNHFVVLGNAEHFSLITKRREAGKKGRSQTQLVAKQRQERRAAIAQTRARRAGKTKAPPKPAKAATTALAPVPKAKPPAVLTEAQRANRACWDAYREAYLRRWEVEPIRNAKTNACVAQFVQRVGQTEAPEVIRFYVLHNDPAYLRAVHPMTLAVRDAEGLFTQYKRGEPITRQQLDQYERASGMADQLRRIDKGTL